MWFPGYGEVAADAYDRNAPPPGWSGRGPALFEERDTCCVVGPGYAVTVDGQHSLVIDIDYSSGKEAAR